MKLQLHKLEGNTFNITEQANSLKIRSDNKEIKDPLKAMTETQENLKELVNTQRDDSSIISNKIKTDEEEIAKSQEKINAPSRTITRLSVRTSARKSNLEKIRISNLERP